MKIGYNINQLRASPTIAVKRLNSVFQVVRSFILEAAPCHARRGLCYHGIVKNPNEFNFVLQQYHQCHDEAHTR